jgi:uncharacterized protein
MSSLHPRAAELIKVLQLRPHPEGGFYREVFRSAATVMPENGRDRRDAVTTIYFLLPEGMNSRWHQVDSDEAWHLYEGGPMELLELDETFASFARRRLAPVNPSDAADRPMHTVRAGIWQAARSLGPYSLAGCTVAPGFDFADFRLLANDRVKAADVRERWPELAGML